MRARSSDKRHVAQDVGRVAADGRLGQQLLHALAGAALGGVCVQHIHAVPESARHTRMLDARKAVRALGRDQMSTAGCALLRMVALQVTHSRATLLSWHKWIKVQARSTMV